MPIVKINDLSENQVDQVVNLHLTCLDESLFLHFGQNFLKSFYRPIPKSRWAIFLLVLEKEKVLGYTLGVIDGRKLLRDILKSSFTPLLFSALPVLVKKPSIILKMFPTTFNQPPELNRPELQFIAVDPKARGRGFGKSLVQTLSQEFAKKGIRQFTVGTLSKNKVSNQFYEHLKFTHVSQHQVFGELQNFFISPPTK